MDKIFDVVNKILEIITYDIFMIIIIGMVLLLISEILNFVKRLFRRLKNMRVDGATLENINNKLRVLELEKRIKELKTQNKKIKIIVDRMITHERWYMNRGGLLPYDWSDYLGKDLRELIGVLEEGTTEAEKE